MLKGMRQSPLLRVLVSRKLGSMPRMSTGAPKLPKVGKIKTNFKSLSKFRLPRLG